MENIEQGSDAWKALRLGKVTASCVADMVAKTKSGWGTSRANYAAQLVAERLTGTVADSFTNAAMQHGTDTEPEARAAYEFYRSVTVEEIAFTPHPTISDAGCSPDGLVSKDGMVEIKCPNTATHIDTLLGQSVPAKYISQIQFQMACSGRKWCDFVSFDNRMPESMRLFVHRIERDDEMIASLEKETISFLDEIGVTVQKLKAIYE